MSQHTTFESQHMASRLFELEEEVVMLRRVNDLLTSENENYIRQLELLTNIIVRSNTNANGDSSLRIEE